MLVHRAEREVIVCGGAYNSPQLLMLSGIGRPAELEELQIEVVAEVPEVGLNLHDHPNAGAVYSIDEEISLFGALNEENLALFEAEGRGPLTSNVAEAGGFMRTQRWARRAGHPVPLRPGALPVRGARARRRPRVRARRMRAQAEEPRVRGARLA